MPEATHPISGATSQPRAHTAHTAHTEHRSGSSSDVSCLQSLPSSEHCTPTRRLAAEDVGGFQLLHMVFNLQEPVTGSLIHSLPLMVLGAQINQASDSGSKQGAG